MPIFLSTLFILVLADTMGVKQTGRMPSLLELFPDYVPEYTPIILNTKTKAQHRIVGGHNSKYGFYKYQLHWSNKGKFECGATLVEVYGIQIALTATHCMWVGSPHQDSCIHPRFIQVTAGDLSLKDRDGREQHRRAKKVVCSPGFDPRYFSNDIAIIFLESGFELNEWVDTAMLPEYGWDEPDGLVVTTGWGAKMTGGHPQDILQAIEIPVLEFDVCKQYNQLGAKITDNQFCVCLMGFTGLHGSCQGDSGGPVIGANVTTKQQYLAGIVSFKLVSICGSPWYPTIYTKVSKYIDWIRIEVSKFREENL